MLLNIITPCMRPENLKKLLYSIVNQIECGYQTECNLKWYIIFDGNKIKEIPSFVSNWINEYKFIIVEIFVKEGNFGNQLRNRALDLIESNNENSWVYFLDDDNLLYPNYLSRINDIISDNIEGILGIQKLKDGLRLASNVSYGLIDTAQFTLKRKLIGDIRFEPFNYAADGAFIETIYKGRDNNGKENKDKFIITNEILCYYNKVTDDIEMFNKIKQSIINSGSGYECNQGFSSIEGGYYIQQHPDEFAEAIMYLRSLERNFQYGLDIGIASGGSTKLLRDFVDIKHTITIDTGEHEFYKHWERIKKEVKSEIVTDILGCSTSDKTRQILAPYKGKIDLVYIDGDHTYDGVKADYMVILPLLADKAILLFHDSKHDHYGIKKFVNELRTDEKGKIKEKEKEKRTIKFLKDIQIHDGIAIFEYEYND